MFSLLGPSSWPRAWNGLTKRSRKRE
uniref:Uncharacterized protein MANES_17G072500 n=1 Tax=Rhizophora mucronata TaxID=61149 RepID=A0A2P2PX05_RHIMU